MRNLQWNYISASDPEAEACILKSEARLMARKCNPSWSVTVASVAESETYYYLSSSPELTKRDDRTLKHSVAKCRKTCVKCISEGQKIWPVRWPVTFEISETIFGIRRHVFSSIYYGNHESSVLKATMKPRLKAVWNPCMKQSLAIVL